MIVRTKPSSMVGLLLTIAFSQCQSIASDPAINWHYVGEGPPVTEFILTPTNPTTLSVITFIAPADGSNYLNGCFAALKYGYPLIAVDPTNRTINVTFSAHPSICPNFALPVSGLEGRVGPLTAGIWSINVAQRFPLLPSFSVELIRPPLSVQAGVGSSIELSWPISGEPYALESTDDLVSGNWQIVTNSPTLSSNTNTLQISADSGFRFFRLHHL